MVLKAHQLSLLTISKIKSYMKKIVNNFRTLVCKKNWRALGETFISCHFPFKRRVSTASRTLVLFALGHYYGGTLRKRQIIKR